MTEIDDTASARKIPVSMSMNQRSGPAGYDQDQQEG